MDGSYLMMKIVDMTFSPRILMSLRLNREDLIIVDKRRKRE